MTTMPGALHSRPKIAPEKNAVATQHHWQSVVVSVWLVAGCTPTSFCKAVSQWLCGMMLGSGVPAADPCGEVSGTVSVWGIGAALIRVPGTTMSSSCELVFMALSGLADAGADVPVVCAAAKPLFNSPSTIAAAPSMVGMN
jgi:hypothetical protein